MDPVTDDARLLEERLKEPQTAAAIHRLLDNIDTLEASLKNISEMTTQAPALIAMAGDTLDGTIKQANANGIDVNERLQNVAGMAEQLSRKASTEQVSNLLALAEQAPDLISMMTDTVDGLMMRAHKSGVDVNEHVGNALGLAQRLTDKNTVTQLHQLLDMSEEAPNFISMMMDTVDGYSQQAQANGIDLNKAVSNGLGAALRLSAKMTPERVAAIEGLMDNLDEETLALATSASQALRTSQNQTTKINAIGLMGKMTDPDVQKALGFLTTFAKQFGQTLK